MSQRIASAMALLAFSLCLIMGMEAGNTIATTLQRALCAMLVTLLIGYVVGLMAQRMLDENVAPEKKEELPEAKTVKRDR